MKWKEESQTFLEVRNASLGHDGDPALHISAFSFDSSLEQGLHGRLKIVLYCSIVVLTYCKQIEYELIISIKK